MLGLAGCSGTRSEDTQYFTVLVIVLGILALFIGLGAYTNVLRDEVNNCAEFDANAVKMQTAGTRFPGKSKPFSLTKVQFGLWTVVIGSSYLYLALCKGDCSETTMNTTAIVLLGIFSGTAATASVMDKREIGDKRPRHQNTPSQGFFTDILSDDTGISVHRFQNVVWTVIAITVYLYKLSKVTGGCQLPELSDTLLALTGMSNATFLALRSQENQSSSLANDNASEPPLPPPPSPPSPPSPYTHRPIPEFYG